MIFGKLYDSFERKFLIGRSGLQRVFESLHRFSLRGMNYDQAATIDKSGELFVIHHVKNHSGTKDNFVLFDVGANKGEYAKALLENFPSCKVYSFEALAGTYEILAENLKGYSNAVYVNKALGSKAEERMIYTDGAGSPLTSFYPVESSSLKTSTVSITTIDLFCAEHKINQIDFLKIDVEGFELEVLRGAEKMVRDKKILAIQFEFGSNHAVGGTTFQHIFQFLSGYKISRVLSDGLREYSSYQPRQEVYLAANYLAELKKVESE